MHRDPEQHLTHALESLRTGSAIDQVIEAIPMPVYATDPQGRVTHWNSACAPFAGRQPTPRDRWCVTWHLYTQEGEPLPHDQCPMAVAVRERRSVRDQIAIAERPDGTRRAFRAYPTPLHAPDGAMTGALNLLCDISESQADSLDEQSERCRRLASATPDRDAARMLGDMACNYRDTASSLRARPR